MLPCCHVVTLPLAHCSAHRSDSEDDSPGRPRKAIPDWARGVNLMDALRRQQRIDPDKIFGSKDNTCNLDNVFEYQGVWEGCQAAAAAVLCHGIWVSLIQCSCSCRVGGLISGKRWHWHIEGRPASANRLFNLAQAL
jgi:hypothetical protein